MTVSAPLQAPSVIGLAGPGTRGEAVREIDDPHTGDRWMLFRDAVNPGGPGRLVLIAPGYAGRYLVASAAGTPAKAAEPEEPPVIRAGDRITVEEDTPVVEAHLEAVALTPAPAGATLAVRLKIGGKVLKVVAVSPGRARLLPEEEAH